MTTNRVIKKLEKMDNKKGCYGSFWKLLGVPIVKMEFEKMGLHTITGKKNSEAVTVEYMLNFLKHLKNINWKPLKNVIEYNNICVFYFE